MGMSVTQVAKIHRRGVVPVITRPEAPGTAPPPPTPATPASAPASAPRDPSRPPTPNHIPAPGKKSTKSGSERLDLIQSDSTNTCISSPLSRTSSSICLSPRPPHFTRPLAAPPERALRQVGASVVVLESTSPILQTHPVPGKYAPRLAPCPCLLPCLTRQILLQLCRRQMARWYGTV